MFFWLVLALVCLAGLILALPLFLNSGARERQLIERRLAAGQNSKRDAQVLSSRFAELFNDPEKVREALSKDNELELAVWRAGFRTSQQRALVYALTRILPLVVLILSCGWLFLSGLTQTNMLYALAAAIIGILLPKRLIVSRADSRMRRIDDELSLFMQMLRILFDAGLAVEQTLRVIMLDGKKVLPEVAFELEAALRRAEQGLDLEAELSFSANALQHTGFTDVVVILRQMIKQGGSAKSTLAKMIEIYDQKRMTDLQEKVGKLSAKMTVVMVFFFFPALLILLAGPGFLSVSKAFGAM